MVVVRWCGQRVGITRAPLIARPEPEWCGQAFYLTILPFLAAVWTIR